MKKISLASAVALALLGATTVANANGTVKSHPAAATAATPATQAAAKTDMAATHSPSGAKNPATVELIVRPANHKSTNFELDFMFPVWQPSSADKLFAIDIRGMLDVNKNKEGNFGGVYRQIINNSFVLGGYLYGDYRRTKYSNSFGQATFGIDALGHMVDGRFNVYVAQHKVKSVGGAQFKGYTGNNIVIGKQFEAAQNGFDGEVGIRIPMSGMNNIETRIFAGGYRFTRSGTQSMAGPRGRLEVHILDVISPGSRLALGVDVSNDKVRKTTVNGVIGLRIPLQFVSGAKAPQGLQRRLADYVYRDVNINTTETTNTHVAMNPSTNKAWNLSHVQGPGTGAAAGAQSGDGTAENPNALWTHTGTQATADIIRFVGSGNIARPATTVTPNATGLIVFGPNTNQTIQDGVNGPIVQIQTAVGSNAPAINITDPTNVGGALFTVGANNPNVTIAGFTYTEGAAATSALISGAYTASSKVVVSDMIVVGNATVTAPQVRLTFNGAQTSTFTGTNINFKGFSAASANLANGILLTQTGGANATANLGKLNMVDTTNAGNLVGVLVSNNASTVTLNDTGGSVFSGGAIAYSFGDITGAVATPGAVNFTINGLTTTNMGTGSVLVNREDGGNVMSNTTIKGTVSNSVFTSAAGNDIVVGGGATTGANTTSAVTLNLTGNKHTNTAGANGLVVTQQTTAGNTSTVVVNMTNVAMTGTTGSGILVDVNGAANQVANAITFVMKGVTTSAGYTNGIDYAGGPVLAGPALGQVKFDLSGGGNVFASSAGGHSFEGATFSGGAAGYTQFALTTAGTFATYSAAQLFAAAGTTFPQNVTY